jgi:hypothetical protein
MTLDGTISGIDEVVCAFGCREGFEDVSDAVGDFVEGSFLGLAQEVFEFGEDLFNGIEVRAVGWEVDESCANASECPPDGMCLVAAEIVHDDNVAWLQCRNQELLHIAEEALAVDRAIHQAGGGDGIRPEGSKEGLCLPMAMRHAGDEPLALVAPTPQRGHIGLGPSLVDEDQSADINPGLMLAPAFALAGDVRPGLFIPTNRFF